MEFHIFSHIRFAASRLLNILNVHCQVKSISMPHHYGAQYLLGGKQIRQLISPYLAELEQVNFSQIATNNWG